MTNEEVRVAMGIADAGGEFFCWALAALSLIPICTVAWSIFVSGKADHGPLSNGQRYILFPAMLFVFLCGGIGLAALASHLTAQRHEQLAAISSETVTVKAVAVKPLLDGNGTKEQTEVTTNEYPDRTFVVKGRQTWESGKKLKLYKYSPKGVWEQSLVTDEK
jgi:hypothetical protein